MRTRHTSDKLTEYLTQTLTGYEVIPANFGWHLHKGDIYCGVLEYQETRGWGGSAYSYLSSDLKEELKKYAIMSSSMPQVAA